MFGLAGDWWTLDFRTEVCDRHLQEFVVKYLYFALFLATMLMCSEFVEEFSDTLATQRARLPWPTDRAAGSGTATSRPATSTVSDTAQLPAIQPPEMPVHAFPLPSPFNDPIESHRPVDAFPDQPLEDARLAHEAAQRERARARDVPS